MSNNNDFDFDVDSILAEFSSTSFEPPVSAQPERRPAGASFEPAPTGSEFKQISNISTIKAPEPWADIQLDPMPDNFTPVMRPPEDTFDHTRKFTAQPHGHARSARPDNVKVPSSFAKFDHEKFVGAAGHNGKHPVKTPEPKQLQPQGGVKNADRPGFLNYFIGFVFAVISVICLSWVALNVHLNSGTTAETHSAKLDLIKKLDSYENNAKSDALGALTYIKKLYTIDQSATVAPKPDESRFGTTDDVNVIERLIDDAAPFLEGQELIWNPEANFVPGSIFHYYFDETIFVITWQEFIDNRCCTCAEVKIAHGSQLRRKIADDTYSSPNQYYASDLAKQCNAVIAVNGDYYLFRKLGITVYQSQVYRNNPATIDTCFFNSSGDMIFSRAGELMNESDTWQYISDNDIVFAVSFGPVLVKDGELQYCATYPIGEIDTEYSRSSISQVDKLHYFLMTINHTPDGNPRANINEFAEILYKRGLKNSYCLDGGQTSEIVMQGEPINHVDYGKERLVSDILYFATAIPESEVTP